MGLWGLSYATCYPPPPRPVKSIVFRVFFALNGGKPPPPGQVPEDTHAYITVFYCKKIYEFYYF